MENYELYELYGRWVLLKVESWRVTFESKEDALVFLKMVLIED
jgi:hypothetical protein